MVDPTKANALSPLLKACSIEITARDRASREAVIRRLPSGSEVFIADLPDQPPEVVREAAKDLRQGGLEPVPHIVARNIKGREELDVLLAGLREEAQVQRILVTGGDRAEPGGPFESALDLIRSGAFQAHGVQRLAFTCYPEGHPHIAGARLEIALNHKIKYAVAAGFEVLLVSQFTFEAEPVVSWTRALRARGIDAPLRVGTAGPADRQTLVEFGHDLGAGNSLERLEQAADTSRRETPERYLGDVARALESEPELGITGVHLFPFGSTDECLSWTEMHR